MAWLDLATSAAFAGHSDLADNAFGRALELGPRNYRVLSWGLELYQPKWLGAEPKLKIVAEQVMKAAPDWSCTQREDIGKQLREAGFAELEKKVNALPR